MFPSLRTRRAAFWYLAPDRIVAAVISRGEREPVLESCAASYSQPVGGARFAPGVVEVSWVLGCEHLVHVGALAAAFCRLVPDDEEEPVGAVAGAERRSRVAGGDGLVVRADEGAVAQASALFRRARLRLLALDGEPCALASLADALGSSDLDSARRQHLSAVAVLPESESAAEALGIDLAVPVGLAVSWFGGGRAH